MTRFFNRDRTTDNPSPSSRNLSEIDKAIAEIRSGRKPAVWKKKGSENVEKIVVIEVGLFGDKHEREVQIHPDSNIRPKLSDNREEVQEGLE